MADLTSDQLQAIRDLVMKHHWAFIANTVGPEAVPADILKELKKLLKKSEIVDAPSGAGRLVAVLSTKGLKSPKHKKG